MLDPMTDIHVEIAEKKRGDVHLRFATADGSAYLAGIVAPTHRQ
jgi:hypothetical protein